MPLEAIFNSSVEGKAELLEKITVDNKMLKQSIILKSRKILTKQTKTTGLQNINTLNIISV